MKRVIKILSLCLVLNLALLSSGCQKDDHTTAQASSQGRYEWASSAREGESSEVDPTFMDSTCFLKPISINGEDILESNSIVSYDGTPLKLRYSFTRTGDIPVNTTVFFTINGVIQPFRLEEEEEERTLYQFESPESTNIRPVFYIDQPIIVSSSQPSLLMVHFLSNYDYQLDQSSYKPISCIETFHHIYIKAEEESSVPELQLDTVSLEQVEYRAEEIYFSDEEQMDIFYYHYGIFKNELPLVSDMFQFEYYMEGTPEDTFYLALSKDEGSYRTVILQDGEPIPAFGGKTYLDWNSAGKDQGIEVQLDSSAFEEGTHNYYALTIPTHIIPSAEDVVYDAMASKPVTIVMEK
ncbi:hypothetical protein [Solibaculum mannosilyticum]|uniref:hypothetical protein n=1 Tax=Solibaculum mannosilyticum TaxID=2780922 RepID=UPI0034B95B69